MLVASVKVEVDIDGPPRGKFRQFVALRFRLAMRSDRVEEFAAWYDADVDYDDQHRFAEHEWWQSPLAVGGTRSFDAFFAKSLHPERVP